jgi:hypothetical protein
MACEVAVKMFVREVGGAKDQLYVYVVDNDRERSIFEYLNDILLLLTGKRTREVIGGTMQGRQITYRHLERLFQARNKVAHEGHAYFPDDNGRGVTVDENILLDFQLAAALFLDHVERERERLATGPIGQGAGNGELQSSRSTERLPVSKEPG